MMYMG
jgi:hypothetical protein